MAAFEFNIYADNRSATYPSWPLIFIELEANMALPDLYTDVSPDDNVIEIFRFNSPNFGRSIYIKQITLTPAPTAIAPVRVYIDPFNRQVFVDPDSAHAQAGSFLQVVHPQSRYFDLLPGMINRIVIQNVPVNNGDMAFGLRWRKAYV